MANPSPKKGPRPFSFYARQVGRWRPIPTSLDEVLNFQHPAGRWEPAKPIVPGAPSDPLDQEGALFKRTCPRDGSCLDNSRENGDNLYCEKGHWVSNWNIERNNGN